MRDQVFRDHHPEIAEFTFDKKVSAVFADMLKRSVPGYGTILSLLAVFARRYAQPQTIIYDLGCSLGAASFAMAQNVDDPTVHIEGYDVSAPMIMEAQRLIAEFGLSDRVSATLEDVLHVEYQRSSLIVLNLTLQFIDPQERLLLLKKLYDALIPGGVLILVEKSSDTSSDALFTELYYDFKRANGYNELEIHQKRTALENILIPDSTEVHFQRLAEAGFSRYEQWFQALIFRGYIAWK